MDGFGETVGKRWPRAQRFRLSAEGVQAEATYVEGIIAARAESGRASFDAARAAWAGLLRLKPEDGVYLVELEEGPRTIADMVEALDSCGSSPKEVKAAIIRLVDARMIEPVPTAEL